MFFVLDPFPIPLSRPRATSIILFIVTIFPTLILHRLSNNFSDLEIISSIIISSSSFVICKFLTNKSYSSIRLLIFVICLLLGLPGIFIKKSLIGVECEFAAGLIVSKHSSNQFIGQTRDGLILFFNFTFFSCISFCGISFPFFVVFIALVYFINFGKSNLTLLILPFSSTTCFVNFIHGILLILSISFIPSISYSLLHPSIITWARTDKITKLSYNSCNRSSLGLSFCNSVQ